MKDKKLPKLGRPFSGDSRRDSYLKVYLNEQEQKEIDRLETDLKAFYDEKGFLYNRPAHIRLLLANLNNPLIIHFLFDHLTPELQKQKKS